MVKYSRKQNEFLNQMFNALFDETRRDILDRVSKAKRLAVSEIAHPYIKEKTMSMPAVLKHIKILGQSNFVKIKAVGRIRFIIANPGAMNKLNKFFNFYNSKLDRVGTYLKEATPKKKTKK